MRPISTIDERFSVEVHVTGWIRTPFGKLEDPSEDLVTRADLEALVAAVHNMGGLAVTNHVSTLTAD